MSRQGDAAHRKAIDMTKQESFKRRVRSRMEKTGEKYAAARRVLIDQSNSSGNRNWVSQPEMSEEAIREATGRGWDAWCDVIESWPQHDRGHTAIASYLRDAHNVDGWWAQTVTVGYERITGLRLPHQMADGTFTAGKSGTVPVVSSQLRAMLLSQEDRADLFPGEDTELRSKPTSKSIRLQIGPGIAQIGLDPAGADRTKVSIAHEKLPTADDVEQWKYYWSEWLEAIGGE